MIFKHSDSRRPIIANASQQRKHRPDYVMLIVSLVLLLLGLIVVYAISPGLSAQKDVSTNYYAFKQLISVLLGIVAFWIASRLNFDTWKKMVPTLVVLACVSAVAVQFFGERVNGAARWVQIGGISFQSVELIKFALIIWLATFLAKRIEENSISNFHKTFKPLLMVIGLVSVVVAIFQSDLGSTAVIIAIIGTTCFIAGLPLKNVIIFSGIVVIGTILAISVSPYRRERLSTFMNPGQDCQNVGYQACQAVSAIGSGGMFGKGINRGVFAYGYLPESANDSIFAIYAEMFGFVGVVVMLLLFVLLFARIKLVLERSPSIYSRLLVAGVLGWLSTQALINIGSMIGLLPLKGITLPLVSYGGTSIIFVMATIGMVFGISRYTTYTAGELKLNESNAYESSAYRRGVRRPYYSSVSRRP